MKKFALFVSFVLIGFIAGQAQLLVAFSDAIIQMFVWTWFVLIIGVCIGAGIVFGFIDEIDDWTEKQ